MVRYNVLRWSLATLALFGARPLLAGPIGFTGLVENDFKKTDPTVQIANVSDNPTNIGPAQFMNDKGWVSGWALKDIRTSYDAGSDTLSVGLNTFKNKAGATAIVGDSDGNGDPGGAGPDMVKAGGIDNPHLGGHKAVVVAFAPNSSVNPTNAGTPVLMAGVPADKATAGPGLDGFSVASYKASDLGLAYKFGSTLNDHLGALAFDPSAAHPGFEFTIKNFSKVAGLTPTKGFWTAAYAGSPDDRIAGEAALDFTRFKAISEQNIPEPATVLGWTIVVGGAALRLRKKTRV